MGKQGKKPFGETKFGQFVKKAAPYIGDTTDIVGKVFTGNWGGAVKDIGGLLKKAKAQGNSSAGFLLAEFEAREQEFLHEERMFALVVEDRKSARSREVEIAKTGKTDILMLITGIVILSLLVMVVVSVFFFDLKNKEMTHFIAGEITCLSAGMAVYYFGSSKGSKDKQAILNKLKDPD